MRNLIMSIALSVMFVLPAFAHGGEDPKPKAKAVVHIYRPNRAVGFGWVFKLKANGEDVGKIRNGRHFTIELEPGQAQFVMNKNNVQLNLEAGKEYYLRASLVRNLLLGRPELVEVTEAYAQSEID